MKILFVHQNFPGQFKHLVKHWVDAGHAVVGLGQGQVPAHDGAQVIGYAVNRSNATGVHPWAQEFESKVIRAEACARAAIEIQQSGFDPDVIFAHPGWGEALFLKAVFPRAKLVCLMEFFYRPVGQDMGFDPEFPSAGFESQASLASKNANLLLSMEAMDVGVSPTPWQASTLPDWVKSKLQIIHEGIDTKSCCPDPSAEIGLPDQNLCVRPGDEVLTFVARNLEPVRGYHIFMRALPEIMAKRPHAKIFIVGGDGVSYGASPQQSSYRLRFLSEVADSLDPKRVFFMGKVPYQVFLRLMQITRCHVYLTYPFVLSWSMLEAMSSGALVVGSNTNPVTDIIQHGKNGVLVDFFDTSGLAKQVCDVLSSPQHYEVMRKAARQTIIDRFDLRSVCLPAYSRLLAEFV